MLWTLRRNAIVFSPNWLKNRAIRENDVKSMRIRARSFGVGAAIGFGLAAAPAMAQDRVITVWWVKGFYKSEDDALLAAIKKFEAKTGIKVELSQYAVQDLSLI